MTETPDSHLKSIISVVEAYLKRPLTAHEKEILEPFVASLAANGQLPKHPVELLALLEQQRPGRPQLKAEVIKPADNKLRGSLDISDKASSGQAINLGGRASAAARSPTWQPMTFVDGVDSCAGAEATESIAQRGMPDDLKSLLTLLNSFKS